MRQCSTNSQLYYYGSVNRVIRNPTSGGMVAAPDVGWMASSAVLLGRCWLRVVHCFSFLSWRPVSLVVSYCFSFLVFSSFIFVSCYFLLQLVWCACLHVFVFAPACSQCGWRGMAKSFCCICNVYLCLVVCDNRSRLSIRHRHGHWLCDRWVEHQFYVKNTYTQ